MVITLNSELERRIAAKVKSGSYQSPAEVVQASLELLEARDAAVQTVPDRVARPVWETVVKLGGEVAQEAWAQVPSDVAATLTRSSLLAGKIAE